MSINGALNNALSGLVAASRAAEVVSSNISNALTEGYGRRELRLSAVSMSGHGVGVRVDGIHRATDIELLTDRRAADAEFGSRDSLKSFFLSVEKSIGLPGEDGSLSARVNELEASLIEATSRPDSQPRLMSALRAAQGLSNTLNRITDDIQGLRQDADREISVMVSDLNTRLDKISALNRDIRLQIGSGHNASALMDQRQAMIDSISAIVPIREMPGEHGEIALITTGGAILLDGKAAKFEFDGVGVITPDMTRQSGSLGAISLNGEEIDTLKAHHALMGGKLDALFRIRDTHAVNLQGSVDGFARDLMERFEDPNIDPTLGGSDPALFTDNGGKLDITDEIGLAGRISVSGLVDPEKGGDLWRLRDGIGAAAIGDAGDATLLRRLADALRSERIPSSGGFIAATRSASGLSSDLLSRAGAGRQNAEFDLSYAAARQQSLRAVELQNGVDSDHEIQQLLVVEQAYSANARVVRAVDEMIEELLGL